MDTSPARLAFVAKIVKIQSHVIEILPTELDRHLFLTRVTAFGEGRLGEDALLYSARHRWKKSGEKAREPGRSVRD